MKLRDTSHFVPADPVRVVRDSGLNGQPVALLGEWRDEHGRVVGYQISTMSMRRLPHQIFECAAPPAPVPMEDEDAG